MDVATRHHVTNAQARRERVYALELLLTPPVKIINNLYDPVIVLVTNRSISVARHLVVQLCDWSRDVMGV